MMNQSGQKAINCGLQDQRNELQNIKDEMQFKIY